jgi:actin cytoskeleton-regulatory complex protein PAN1
MAAIVTHAPIADNRRLMPIALIVGPLAAVVGIVAIFFVFRRKAVDQRSMYSARRSQIEHKVRAARQRTLAPHGREERPPEAAPGAAPTSVFAPTPRGPQITYEASAYEPPPAAPPPVSREVRDTPSPSPWDVGPTAPAPTEFVTPEAPPAPVAPEPAYTPPPIEEVWTPAPAPQAPPVEPSEPAAAAASPAAWSVVQEAKASAEEAGAKPKKKGKKEDPGASWTLASGNAPGMEPDDIVKAPSPLVPIAQYLVLVVGLVMVLIGVFVMIANSHVT